MGATANNGPLGAEDSKILLEWIPDHPGSPKSFNKLTTLKARILEGMQMWDVVWAQSYQHSRVYSAPHWLVWDCLFDILFKTLAAQNHNGSLPGNSFLEPVLAQECNLQGYKSSKRDTLFWSSFRQVRRRCWRNTRPNIQKKDRQLRFAGTPCINCRFTLLSSICKVQYWVLSPLV